MKVYIVLSGVAYEGEEILSVHKTIESAIDSGKDAVRKYGYGDGPELSADNMKVSPKETDCVWVCVEEFEVKE